VFIPPAFARAWFEIHTDIRFATAVAQPPGQSGVSCAKASAGDPMTFENGVNYSVVLTVTADRFPTPTFQHFDAMIDSQHCAIQVERTCPIN